MKEQLIITHPGSAHFDEVTAIGLILAAYDVIVFHVERREPMTSEFDDPSVWVIDIGNRLDPEKHNFDHHQSLSLPASFIIVAEYLGLAEPLSIMPWWYFKEEVDRFGPIAASSKYHAGDELVNRNPMESWLTARFASDPEGSLPLLRSFGLHIIREAHLLKKQIEFWDNCPKLVIAGVPAIIGETRESAGLEEFRRLDKNPPDIVITMDRRGPGWRLFRYEGVPVDFSLISDCPEIAFAHKNGFMAITKERLDIEDLTPLISKSVLRK